MHQLAKWLELQLQHQSFQWIFRIEFLSDWLVWSLCSPKVSQESSPILQLKTSLLQCSAVFMAQLSHPYITTGKTIALTRQTFVGKVMSLLFNMLSRLVIAFLPRSKHHLISWLQSPSAVGSLVPCRIPWGGTRTLSKATLLFLNCSSLFFFLRTFPSLTRNCLNLPFGKLGKSRKLNEIYFL